MLQLLFWSECRDSNSKQCCTACGIACGGCPHSLLASREPLGDGNQEASSSHDTAKEKDRKRKSISCLFGPSVEIRTRGLLNPIQARYQTSPHPDFACHFLTASVSYHTLSENASIIFSFFEKFQNYSPTSDLMTLPMFQRVTTFSSAAFFSASFSYST